MVNNDNKRSKNSTRSRVLHLLKEGNKRLSGELLSRELNLSRVAVWKAIQKLREEGYAIESGKQGYSLVNQGISDMDLQNIHYPGEVLYLPQTGSTMEEGRRLQQKGTEQFLIIAGEQTRGIGKNQRPWESADGGLFMTAGGPCTLPLAFSGLIAMEILIRTAAYFRKISIPIEIKWPNDLYLEGKKIGGLLTEYRSQGERIDHLSLGLGMNVNNPLPEKQAIHSLKQFSGKEWDRSRLISDLAEIQQQSMADLQRGESSSLVKKACFMKKGTALLDHCWEGEIAGTVQGLDSLGNLIWQNGSGLRHISPGECNKLIFS